MKALTVVVSLLLAFVTYGSTTVRFDGQNSGFPSDDKWAPLMNGDSVLAFDRPSTYDSSGGAAEFGAGAAVHCVPNTDDPTAALPDNDGNAPTDWGPPSNVGGGDDDKYDDNDGDKDDDTDDDTDDDGGGGAGPSGGPSPGGFGPGAIGPDMVRRAAAVDRIVADERRRAAAANRTMLLDVEWPLPVKRTAVKVTKRNYVSFQDAEVRGLEDGRLERLSVDGSRDRVRADCTFARLAASGAFKTNLRHTRAGLFYVDVGRVYSNVTAAFRRRGRRDDVAPAAPAGRKPAAAQVVAADRGEADVVAEAADRLYRPALHRAVSAAVLNATHHGLAARLKAVVGEPLGDHGRAAGLFDVDWTSGDGLTVRTSVAGVRPSSGRHVGTSVSYVRAVDGDGDAYAVRVDFGLGELRWTADVDGSAAGRGFRARDVEFAVDDFRARVTVVRPEDGGRCREVDARARARGFRTVTADDGRMPADVRNRMPDIVERSFATLLRDSVEREVCGGRTSAAVALARRDATGPV